VVAAQLAVIPALTYLLGQIREQNRAAFVAGNQFLTAQWSGPGKPAGKTAPHTFAKEGAWFSPFPRGCPSSFHDLDAAEQRLSFARSCTRFTRNAEGNVYYYR